MKKEINPNTSGLKRPPPPPAPPPRYANEYISIRSARRKQQEFIESVAPYVAMRSDIYASCTSTTTILKDGKYIECVYNFSDAQKGNLILIDELIESKRRQIFNT